jgi:hypothetical protein
MKARIRVLSKIGKLVRDAEIRKSGPQRIRACQAVHQRHGTPATFVVDGKCMSI